VAADANAAFHAVVTGRVQGVGFRYSAVREARRFGLRGSVFNSGDSSVEVHAEGDLPKLERFLAWLHEGPPGAHVRDVEVTWGTPTGSYSRFDVEF